MSRRGRKPGYHNYSTDEQLLLCELAAKYKPIGRNEWEDLAMEYNLRRGRKWIERDYDSLRRKSRNLYGKSKPTGINGDIPPKLRPIAMAQEAQRAIEEKGGSHTSHDGGDGVEDDVLLLQDVDAALNGSRKDPADDSEADHDTVESGSEEECVVEDDSQSEGDGFMQLGQHTQEDSQSEPARAVGTITTRSGTFDASLGDLIGDEDEDNPPRQEARVNQGALPRAASQHSETAVESNGLTPRQQAERSSQGDLDEPSQPETPRMVTPINTARLTLDADGPASTRTNADQARSAGRPKGGKKASAPARPTYSSPEGRPLSRDAGRAAADAREASVHGRKNTASNRLGGCDLRVLRDNMDELTGKSPRNTNKRDASDISSTGATYAANKRARAKKRLDQLKRELDEAEEKQSSAGTDVMQMLLFMREDADRRLEAEDRRRREDREAKQAADKVERDARESLRRDEATAYESRRLHEQELARELREEKNRKESAAAAENRLRYEERLERDRAETRERHEQMMLLIASMQRSSSQPK